MSISPFDSALYGNLLGDKECAALLSDEAAIAAMLDVEAALASAQAAEGHIPADAANRICDAIKTHKPNIAALAAGTSTDGIPVPALVRDLRDAVGGEAASYIHWGATSQDVMDTALALLLKSICNILEQRLTDVSDALAHMANKHRHTAMVARTRTQQASPTTFGLKVAHWLAPLLRHRERLYQLRPRVLVLSLGGASGTMSALGPDAPKIAARMAEDLGLTAPDLAPHNQRDGLVEFSAWLAMMSGSIGKVGMDIATLCQTEIGELRMGSGGGSSTMPQKNNPVTAEILVALARHNATLAASAQHAMLHGQERDGAAWMQEWLFLPEMVVATGRSLTALSDALNDVIVDEGRMRANLTAPPALAFAEAASFALAQTMPRAEAQAQVKAACQKAIASNRSLIDVLKSEVPDISWEDLSDPLASAGPVDTLIDAVLHRL